MMTDCWKCDRLSHTGWVKDGEHYFPCHLAGFADDLSWQVIFKVDVAAVTREQTLKTPDACPINAVSALCQGFVSLCGSRTQCSAPTVA